MHSFSSLIFLTFKVFSWICSCLFVLLPPGAVEVVLSPRLAEVFRKSNHLITHWLFSHFHPLGVSNMTPLSHRSEVCLMFKIIPGLAPPPSESLPGLSPQWRSCKVQDQSSCCSDGLLLRDTGRPHTPSSTPSKTSETGMVNGGHRFRGRGHYIIQFRPHWRASSCCCCWLLDIRGVLLFCIFSLTSPTKPVFSQMRCIHGVGASPTANEKAKSLLDSLVSCAVRLAASNPVFKSLCVVAAHLLTYLQRALLQNCALWKTLGSLGDFLSFRSRNTFGCSLCKYILLWFKSS